MAKTGKRFKDAKSKFEKEKVYSEEPPPPEPPKPPEPPALTF